jgi:putative oxidoreductase
MRGSQVARDSKYCWSFAYHDGDNEDRALRVTAALKYTKPRTGSTTLEGYRSKLRYIYAVVRIGNKNFPLNPLGTCQCMAPFYSFTGIFLMRHSLDSGVILLARITLAIFFVWNFVMKMTGYETFLEYLHSVGVPLVQIAAPCSIAMDFAGGLFLILGFKIRPVAVIMPVYIVATAILGHHFWNIPNPAMRHDDLIEFLKNITIAGGFLPLLVTGAGRIGIDRA